MNKTQTDSDGKDLCTWAIPFFPRTLKNKFLGAAKTQGKVARTLLANLVREYLWKQKKGQS